MNARAIGLAAAVLLTAGCSPFGGTSGELGHGEFFYQCVDNGDIACDDHRADVNFEITSADGKKLPRAVAVGAPFELLFQEDRGLKMNEVRASAPELAVHSDIGFALVEPTTVSFLAFDGDDQISDFIDITAEEVATISAFHDGFRLTKVELRVGEQKDLGAFTRGASDTPLSGNLTWGWTSSDEKVVALDAGLDNETANERKVLGRSPGQATITVRTQGKSLDIPVTVLAD